MENNCYFFSYKTDKVFDLKWCNQSIEPNVWLRPESHIHIMWCKFGWAIEHKNKQCNLLCFHLFFYWFGRKIVLYRLSSHSRCVSYVCVINAYGKKRLLSTWKTYFKSVLLRVRPWGIGFHWNSQSCAKLYKIVETCKGQNQEKRNIARVFGRFSFFFSWKFAFIVWWGIAIAAMPSTQLRSWNKAT